ncbi:DUF1636 domain-containing protein [Synechococcus sp. H55.11]|uniref:DUF1636 domain-containing protein n=1 Tax=unclassified Synechococcus TaxID=2626047 RepID=UPI0039C1EAA2
MVSATNFPSISPSTTLAQAESKHCLWVCTTCGSRWVNGQKEGISKGEMLLAALQSQRLNPQLQLKPVACMSGCSHACVVALAAPRKMTYVFGDLDPKDVEPILQTAELYLAKPDGILPWAERPIKKGVIARIPPIQ